MAFGDYSGYAWLNGKRRRDREENDRSYQHQHPEEDSIPDCPDDQIWNGHISLGDDSVRLVGYKCGGRLFVKSDGKWELQEDFDGRNGYVLERMDDEEDCPINGWYSAQARPIRGNRVRLTLEIQKHGKADLWAGTSGYFHGNGFGWLEMATKNSFHAIWHKLKCEVQFLKDSLKPDRFGD